MGKNPLGKILLILMTMAWSLMPFSFGLAQVSFPTRPVTIWVGFPAGGGADIVTRAVAEGAEKSLGQKIVVMNKPGGGGAVCASLIAKEKPDGYTLAISPDTPITRTPHLRDLDYDSLQDLSFIIRLGRIRNVFVVRADSPFNKWQDVVDWAKKNPGQLVHGHPGAGTSNHLAMVKLALKEGFTYKSVPFAGDAPLVGALLGGHATIVSGNAMVWKSHVEAKAVRVLLVVEKEGLDYAPEVPTFEKAGYNFETPAFYVAYGPKKIPEQVRAVWEKAFLEGIKSERFRAATINQGLLSQDPLTGRALFDYVTNWHRLYEQYIKEAGIYKMEKK